MENEQLINWCRENRPQNRVLEIPEFIFKLLNEEQTKLFENEYPNETMFKLPEREIKFFDWLKKNDPNIWADIWSDDLFPPYYVSIGLFHLFIEDGYKGFPICDLQNNDNYYFAPQHLADKESGILVESAKSRYMEREALTIPQWLALSISMGPLDIWHFSYKNELSLSDCKDSVKMLVEENLLVHLKEAEHLSIFVEV